jgi:hypothetical protein
LVHSIFKKRLKLWRLSELVVSIGKYRSKKGGQLLGKAYGIKVWCYWEHLGGADQKRLGNMMGTPLGTCKNAIGTPKF